MSTLELKQLLIHRISEINDVSFLKAIKTILDSKSEKQIIKLTAEQRSEIIQSKKDIENNLFVDQVELNKEVEKWLNEK
jgi:hypothetical protein